MPGVYLRNDEHIARPLGQHDWMPPSGARRRIQAAHFARTPRYGPDAGLTQQWRERAAGTWEAADRHVPLGRRTPRPATVAPRAAQTVRRPGRRPSPPATLAPRRARDRLRWQRRTT